MAKSKPEASVDRIVERIAAGERGPLYLVSGDGVVAEPAAEQIARALAEAAGCELETHRRPADLGSVLADLRTFSLFASAKVVWVVESSVFADRASAASLIDEAAECIPSSSEVEELSSRELRSARRLLQALRLFGVSEAADGPAEALAKLPAWALKGGSARKRARSKKQIEDLLTGLETLLAAARSHQVEGWSDSDQAAVGEALAGGFPEGHSLILNESAVAKDHPVVSQLTRRASFVELESIEHDRSGWSGLGALAAQLEQETGAPIARPALEELARRTLREQGGRSKTAQSDTTARFAAEYRKLAATSGGSVISRALVEGSTEDRGAEDVWSVLDAIGQGRAGQALDRVDRIMAAAADPMVARLSLFAMLADFSRQLVAVGGLVELHGLPRTETNYHRFKSSLAPKIQAELPGAGAHPVQGLHPFRLFRSYQAAARIPVSVLRHLPRLLLDTEMRLKGESSRPRAALADLVCQLSRVVRGH